MSGIKDLRWTGPDFSKGQKVASGPYTGCMLKNKQQTSNRVHGVKAMDRDRVHIDPELEEPCTEIETLAHLFVQCPHLLAPFDLIKNDFKDLGNTLILIYFFYFCFYKKKCVKRKNCTQVGERSV